MAELKKVIIGIQARSTSKRFPKKVHELLGDKTVLDHMITAAQDSIQYVNHFSHKNGCVVSMVLCIPFGDIIKNKYSNYNITEGPEHDVLKRYSIMQDAWNADYVVRITADCPLIPSFIISTHIMKAVLNKYDYFSNVDERCRTTPDGWDCEVISKRLLKYVDENALDLLDREHVTTFIRSHPPAWIKQGTIINFLDLSDMKVSFDTKADQLAIKDQFEKREAKLKRAISIYGKTAVHRI